MSEYSKVTAVILAGGTGSRMNADVTKQKMNIAGQSVLRHSVLAFASCRDISDIVVVARAGEEDFARAQCIGIEKGFKIVTGGETRADSAKTGFYSIPKDSDYVAIHDAARCLITHEMISRVVCQAKEFDAATAATPVTDTVKRIDSEGMITETVRREDLWLAMTPQVFKSELYRKALESHRADDASVTDDNMLLERIGVAVKCVDVGRENVKITRAEDISYAEYVLLHRIENT